MAGQAPRVIDFERFREIADTCGAAVDSRGAYCRRLPPDSTQPVEWADIVTTTTHKTLRVPAAA
ncbi:MAG: hypothetical protein ACLRXC_04775 [[Clostridium] leptum]